MGGSRGGMRDGQRWVPWQGSSMEIGVSSPPAAHGRSASGLWSGCASTGHVEPMGSLQVMACYFNATELFAWFLRKAAQRYFKIFFKFPRGV